MTPFPKRIQLSRAKGWRMPEHTVKVDRSTKWGNPFLVGEHGSSEECVKLYTLLIAGKVCISKGPPPDRQFECLGHVQNNITSLIGMNLACWCRYDRPCHADVLIELARIAELRRNAA